MYSKRHLGGIKIININYIGDLYNSLLYLHSILSHSTYVSYISGCVGGGPKGYLGTPLADWQTGIVADWHASQSGRPHILYYLFVESRITVPRGKTVIP